MHAGMPHHVILSFGKNAEQLRRLARALKVEWWARMREDGSIFELDCIGARSEHKGMRRTV